MQSQNRLLDDFLWTTVADLVSMSVASTAAPDTRSIATPLARAA